MSWVNVRRTYQVFFFLLFLALLYLAAFGQKRFPVSLFLELDPLLALASALASKVVFAGMALALIVVVITLVFGRVFCSWICPLGILNHWISEIPPLLKRRDRIRSAHAWRPVYRTKYYVLVALLVLSLFGVLQVGLLDPIALVVRSFALVVLPGLNLAGVPLYAAQPAYLGGWLVGALFLLILAANRYIPRLWCRMLCPLGALLGLISKYSLLRINRDTGTCRGCHKCNEDCHGACEPFDRLRQSECVMCLNCVSSCPQSGVGYRFLPDPVTERPSPDLERRKTVAAVAGGLALLPALRTSQGVLKGADHDVIRPPGSLAEVDFAAKCVKCGACMRICPTGVIQPAALQAGFEGIWTPILRYDVGFCTHDCVLCSRACPTGAIRPITPQQRVGDPRKKQEPIKIGTAFYDRGRCLPWAMATPCIVCEEVCPTSPKAIWVKEGVVEKSDGTKIKVQLPYVDPDRCIGCGTCQYRCPVGARAAIRVSSVGETRSPDNKMVLKSY